MLADVECLFIDEPTRLKELKQQFR